jgi:hypothetical protein
MNARIRRYRQNSLDKWKGWKKGEHQNTGLGVALKEEGILVDHAEGEIDGIRNRPSA